MRQVMALGLRTSLKKGEVATRRPARAVPTQLPSEGTRVVCWLVSEEEHDTSGERRRPIARLMPGVEGSAPSWRHCFRRGTEVGKGDRLDVIKPWADFRAEDLGDKTTVRTWGWLRADPPHVVPRRWGISPDQTPAERIGLFNLDMSVRPDAKNCVQGNEREVDDQHNAGAITKLLDSSCLSQMLRASVRFWTFPLPCDGRFHNSGPARWQFSRAGCRPQKRRRSR